MIRGESKYIWQHPDWPAMRYDLARLAGPLADAARAQGEILGRLADIGLPLREQATVLALTDDVLKTSEIEGEQLDAQAVRSSLARRLGVDVGALAPADRHVDGVVDMVLDATRHADQPLTPQRLFGWHAALFPTGYSGLSPIRIGALRDDADGPMQVVSGPPHRRTVHFEAPPAERLAAELDNFLAWFNADTAEHPLIKAGLAHLWLVTLHPFDDGNGRIARAVGDLLLARTDGIPQRYYSVSAQIQRERSAYYDILEDTQKGPLDVTDWLLWFLDALRRALQGAQVTLDTVLAKARFWQRWADTPMNARQIKVLNRLLDGFDGKLTTRKWAAITKCSLDTALRDVGQLIEFGVLRRIEVAGQGKSTCYECIGIPEYQHAEN